MTSSTNPVHPGEVLREEVKELGYSARKLAAMLHVPVNRITAILNGQRGVTADTALRLALFFDTTAEFWLNLQMAYDLTKAKIISGELIEQEVKRRGTV